MVGHGVGLYLAHFCSGAVTLLERSQSSAVLLFLFLALGSSFLIFVRLLLLNNGLQESANMPTSSQSEPKLTVFEEDALVLIIFYESLIFICLALSQVNFGNKEAEFAMLLENDFHSCEPLPLKTVVGLLKLHELVLEVTS